MGKKEEKRGDQIKIGICVAYDWHLLRYSLPLVYPQAGTICLSIDKSRMSLTGKPYDWDEKGFRRLISRIDTAEKIMILEEDFYSAGLTPFQVECVQRIRMAERLGKSGWHVQIDCDEYLLDFQGFVNFLRKLSRTKKKEQITVLCPMVSLYKQVDDGFLAIVPHNKHGIEHFSIATKGVSYEQGRARVGALVYTNFRILHQSWARSPAEIRNKIYNWTHSNELDKETYLEKWNTINSDNYHQFRDIHPLVPACWPRLELLKGDTIDEILASLDFGFFPTYSKIELLLRNSSFFSRPRVLFSRK